MFLSGQKKCQPHRTDKKQKKNKFVNKFTAKRNEQRPNKFSKKAQESREKQAENKKAEKEKKQAEKQAEIESKVHKSAGGLCSFLILTDKFNRFSANGEKRSRSDNESENEEGSTSFTRANRAVFERSGE